MYNNIIITINTNVLIIFNGSHYVKCEDQTKSPGRCSYEIIYLCKMAHLYYNIGQVGRWDQKWADFMCQSCPVTFYEYFVVVCF